MALFQMHCQYCGHMWEYNAYFSPKHKEIRCDVCNDPNIKYKPLEEVEKNKDVFGYNKKEE